MNTLKISLRHKTLFVLDRILFKLINNLRRNIGLRTKVKSLFNGYRSQSRKLDRNLTTPRQTNENSCNPLPISFQAEVTELDPKKIGLCIGSLGHGGAEKQWVLLAVGLKLLGYTPIFIIQQNLNEASPTYVKFLNDHKINIFSISDFRDFSNTNFEDDDFRAEKYFNKETLQEVAWLYNDTDQILKYTLKYLSHSGFSSLFIALDYANVFFGSAGLIANVPKLLLSFRSISPNFYPENDIAPELYKSVVKHDKVILHGNADHVLKSYSNYFQILKKFNIIKNLDYDLNDKIYEKCSCDKFHILGFMRLSKEKNPIAWCKAAEYLFDNLEFKFHFILSGNGPQFSAIFDEVIRLKYKGMDIELTYLQDSINSMKKFRPGLLINSSLTEGNSNLLIESNSINYPTYSLFDNFLDLSAGYYSNEFSYTRLLIWTASLISDTTSSTDTNEHIKDPASLKSHATEFLNLIQ